MTRKIHDITKTSLCDLVKQNIAVPGDLMKLQYKEGGMVVEMIITQEDCDYCLSPPPTIEQFRFQTFDFSNDDWGSNK